jgi:hypothetical protein
MDLHNSPLTGDWPYDIGIAGSRDDIAHFSKEIIRVLPILTAGFEVPLHSQLFSRRLPLLGSSASSMTESFEI